MSKDTVFSGVQPTGEIHLGNYLGAIKQFLKLQNDSDSIFCIVDQHAITVFQNPEELKDSTLNVLAIFLASGLDPKKCVIFNQSSVKEHSVLSWYLSCTARVGWLNRMTQFKDKAGKIAIMPRLVYMHIQCLWLQTYFCIMLTRCLLEMIKNST